jgi:4-amino-4-deoxy-L-arabinose transferase-like glycosyltransferase
MSTSGESRTARRRLSRIQIAAAALFAFIVLAQGISAPFQKDAEPQSAEWIVSVARDGNWLIPRDYYGVVDRKPPLYYWVSAIAARAAGGKVDEVRARIVSVLCAVVIATEVLAWTAAEIGATEGWLAFLFLLGIYGFSSRATLALTDMLMTTMLMSAWVVLYPLFNGADSLRRAAAAGVLLGLGILTKGPVVLVLAGFAALIFALLSRMSAAAMLRQRWPWIAAIIAIVIAAAWYVPWLAIGGRRQFLIFLKENLGHFAPAGLGGTGEASRPVWYILARLIGGANPIILLVPATLAGFATGEISGTQRRPLLFQASLVAAVVIFFSIASAKRDDYILPALPGIAILGAAAFGMGRPAQDFAGGAKIRDGVSWLIAFAAMLAVVLAFVTARSNAPVSLPLHSSDAEMMALLERGIGARSAPYVAALLFIAAAATAAMVFLARGLTAAAGAAVGMLSLGGVVLINACVRPELAWARSYKSFVAQIRDQIQGHEIFVARNADFELAFYYGKAVPPLTGARASSPPSDSVSYLVAREGEFAMLPREYRDRSRPVLRSNLVGGDGPPVLYALDPAAGLNGPDGIAR